MLINHWCVWQLEQTHTHKWRFAKCYWALTQWIAVCVLSSNACTDLKVQKPEHESGSGCYPLPTLEQGACWRIDHFKASQLKAQDTSILRRSRRTAKHRRRRNPSHHSRNMRVEWKRINHYCPAVVQSLDFKNSAFVHPDIMDWDRAEDITDFVQSCGINRDRQFCRRKNGIGRASLPSFSSKTVWSWPDTVQVGNLDDFTTLRDWIRIFHHINWRK